MSWRPTWWLDALKIYWPLNHLAAKATHWKIVGPLITRIARPVMGKKSFNVTYIPIHAKIDPPASSILTEGIIDELIRRSAHRVVIKRCSCRDSKDCKEYPAENSCLLLGEDTQRISSEVANHVTIEDALRHTHHKISLGLIPMMGRVRMDDFYYGVPNHGKMLSICFCCPCCCTILNSARYFPDEFRASIVPLKGVEISIDHEKCAVCGTCVNACLMKAITLEDGRIVHDDNLCIRCGRCSSVCPEGATTFTVLDCNGAIDELLGRIKERVQVE